MTIPATLDIGVNYDHNVFKVQATVATIRNYDGNTYIIQAASFVYKQDDIFVIFVQLGFSVSKVTDKKSS
jgi:hypothetical protein